MRTGARLMAAAIALALTAATGAQADPASLRVETVESVVINGALDIGGGQYISYRISAVRKSGQHLVGTTKTPGTTYKTTSGCVYFTSSFFSDSGCGTVTGFSLTESLSKGKGAFIAKMRQARVKVKISFSATGTGTTTETPRPSYGVSQPTLSANATVGRWFDRFGRPTGSFLWPGFPRAPLSGGATLSRGTVVLASVDA